MANNLIKLVLFFLIFTVPISSYGEDETTPEELAESLNLPPEFAENVKDDDAAFQLLRQTLGDPIYAIVETDKAHNTPGNATVVTWLIGTVAGVATIMVAIWIAIIFGKGLIIANTTGFGGRKSGDNAGITFAKAGAITFVNTPLSSIGGLSFSQATIIGIAVAGIAAGSAVWKVASEKMLSQPLIAFQYTDLSPLFVSALQSKACLSYATKHGYIAEEDARLFRTVKKKYGILDDEIIHIGKNGICGTLSLKIPAGEPTSLAEYADNENESTGNYFTTQLNNVVNWTSKKSDQAIASVSADGELIEIYIHANANTAVYTAISDIVFDDELSAMFNQILEETKVRGQGFTISAAHVNAMSMAYSRFEQRIVSSMSTLMQNVNCNRTSESESIGCKANQALSEELSRYGFLMAGSHVMTLNQRQSMITSAINSAIPNSTNFSVRDFLLTNQISASSLATDSYFNMFYTLERVFFEHASANNDALASSLNRAYESATEDSALSEAAGDVLVTGLRSIITAATTLGEHETMANAEPIAMLRSMGNWMVNLPITLKAGEAILPMIAGPIGGAAGVLIKNKSAIDSAIDVLPLNDQDKNNSITQMLIDGAALVGLFFSQVIPNLPFVLWILSAVNYIVYVLIAAVAVPLMLMSRLVSDSPLLPDITTLATDLFLRPILLIVGLLIAMAVSRVFGGFVNAVFFETFQLNQSGNIAFASVIGLPILWGILMTVVVYKSYSLINELPAQVVAFMRGEMRPDFDTEKDKQMLVGNFQSAGSRTGQTALNHGDKPVSSRRPGKGQAAKNMIKKV